MTRVAVIATSLIVPALPAHGETLDLACRYSPVSGDPVDVRLIIDTDRRSVTEIWSNGPSSGKSYGYALTEVSAQFIRYSDDNDQRTRRVTIDRIAGAVNVKRTNANGSSESFSYPCRRATQKF